MSVRLGKAAVVAVAATALAAGCGSSSKSTSSSAAGGAPAPATSAPATGTPIKMGLLAALSGVGGSATKYLKTTTQSWVDWVNATGGLGGHPVQLFVGDSKSDPATAIAAVNTLLNTDKIDVLAMGDVAAELAAGKTIAASGVPVVGFGYTPLWNSAPNFFATSAVIPTLYSAQPQAAKAVGGKAFGAVACSEVPTCGAGAPVYQAGAQALGLKWTGQLTASLSAASYTAECLKLMQGGTDVIAATMNASALIRLAQNCQQQGFAGHLEIGAGSVVQSDLTSVPGKTAGYIWAFPWWANTPEAKTFASVNKQYGGGAGFDDANSSALWAGLEVLHKATAKLGATATSATITAALDTVKGETLDGMLPAPVTFTAGKPSPAITCTFLFDSTAGKSFTTVTQGQPGNGGSGDTASSCVPSAGSAS